MALSSTWVKQYLHDLDDVSSESDEETFKKSGSSTISDIPVKGMENRMLLSNSASEYVTAVTSTDQIKEPPFKKQKYNDEKEIKETPKMRKLGGRKLEFEDKECKLMVWWRLKTSLYYRAGWVMKDKENSMLKLTSLDGDVYPFDAYDVVFVKEIPNGSIVFKTIDISLQGVKLLENVKCYTPNELTKIAFPDSKDCLYSKLGQLYLHQEQIHWLMKKGIAFHIHQADLKMRWGKNLYWDQPQMTIHKKTNPSYQQSQEDFSGAKKKRSHCGEDTQKRLKTISREGFIRVRAKLTTNVITGKEEYLKETVVVKRKYCQIE